MGGSSRAAGDEGRIKNGTSSNPKKHSGAFINLMSSTKKIRLCVEFHRVYIDKINYEDNINYKGKINYKLSAKPTEVFWNPKPFFLKKVLAAGGKAERIQLCKKSTQKMPPRR